MNTYKGKTLALLGTGSLQAYLFRDNKMKHNVRASRLVADALTDEFRGCRQIYAGGGHRALLFDNDVQARDAIRAWKLCFLDRAPGLPLVAACEEVRSSLKDAFREAVNRLAAAAGRAGGEVLRPALPVVRECPVTGMAATHRLKLGREVAYVSHESIAKREHGGRKPDDTPYPGWEWPEDLNHMGTPEGASQLLLAHPDIDGAGRLFDPEHLPDADDAFAAEINRRSHLLKAALSQTMAELKAEIARRAPGFQKDGLVKLDGNQFPFLPLVQEADEATFLVPAKIGFDAVLRFLTIMKDKLEQSFPNGGLSASAGVLVMPRGFPFSRAYDMVAALCSSAKRKRRQDNSHEPHLDFHVIAEGATGDIGQIRAQAYRTPLCDKRPYSIEAFQQDVIAPWRHFTTHWPRSRCKGLLQAIAESEDKARAVQRLYSDQGYKAPRPDPYELFDALELLDFLHPWKEEDRNHAAPSN